MAESPSAKETYLVSLEILTNGRRIKDTIEILAVEIEKEADSHDQAYITINDGKTHVENFEITNSKTFELDANIEIKLGYDNALLSVFKGNSSGQLLTNSTGSNHLNIICKSNSITAIDKDFSKPPVLEIDYEQDVITYELLLHKDNSTQIEGFVSFKGYTNTNVNDTIVLKNFGKKFNEVYLITKVIHHVSNGDWITTAYIISRS